MPSRTLSVILAADAVGYSRLSEKDEAAALAAVAWFRERAAEIVAAHEGRIFFRAGDGIMAELPSAGAGVRAALELAETVRMRVANADRPALPIRIGVHLGDVAPEGDGDRMGHDVNVAARLEQIAEAGEVLVSRALAEAAKGKVAAVFERVGRERLKNLSDPVEVFRVVSAATPRVRRPVALIAAAAAAVAVAAAGLGYFGGQLGDRAPESAEAAGSAASAPVADASIAVLPFADMSPEGDQEYFSDGLSEELLNQLAQIDGLKVIARTSSFAFKGQNVDMRTIGQTLGVAHLLEGSVRKAGDELRINAQLINASDGSQVWSQTYNRELADVFSVQEEIAREVAERLSATLGVGAPAAGYDGADSFEAYDHFLRGRAAWNRSGAEGVREAFEEFGRATEIDPQFGAAWVGLARAAQLLGVFEPGRIDELTAILREASARAAAASPDRWESRAIVARLLLGERDWLGAQRALDDASQAGRASAAERADIEGEFLMQVGRAEDALALYEAARASDPLSFALSTSTAWQLERAGRSAEALAEFDRSEALTDRLDPAFAIHHLWSLLNAGDRAAIRSYVARFPHSDDADGVLQRRIIESWESPADGLAALRAMRDSPTVNGAMESGLALFAAYFGDVELALAMERDAFFGKNSGIPAHLWHPLMAEVRRTEGFKQIVTDLGLVDYWRESGEWSDFCRPLGEDDFECS